MSSTQVDIQSYDAYVSVVPSSHAISGWVTIALRTSLDASSVRLDTGALSIDEVRVSEQLVTAVSDRARGETIVPLTPDHGLRERLFLRFHGSPTQGVTLTERYVHTVFHTDEWMPCSMDPGDRATLRLRVEVPSSWTVVATGLESGAPVPQPVYSDVTQAPEAAGIESMSRIFEFALDEPHPSYLMGFAAGALLQSRVHDDAPAHTVWSEQPLSPATLSRLVRTSSAAMTLFGQIAGIELPQDRYHQVVLPEVSGQELANMALLGADYVEPFSQDETKTG